jgi:hypothetical protein
MRAIALGYVHMIDTGEVVMSNRNHRGIELSTRDAVQRSADPRSAVTNDGPTTTDPVRTAAADRVGVTQVPTAGAVADPRGDRAASSSPTGSASAGPTGPVPARPMQSRPVEPVPGGPAGRIALAGLLAMLVGAFGAIVPFAAPGLGYSADGAPSWFWDLSHVVLWLVPGAAAFAAGAVVLLFVGPTSRGRGRFGVALAGMLTMVCGAWFVIGPLAWPVLRNSAGVFVPAAPLRELGYQTGYSLGPGAVLLLLGGLVVGWGMRGRTRLRHGAHGVRSADPSMVG